MTELNSFSLLRLGLLWVVVVSSAVAVTHFSHLCREQYTQLTAMEREANQLQVDYGRYLLEQSAWGSLQRVESIAIEQWQWVLPRLIRSSWLSNNPMGSNQN